MSWFEYGSPKKRSLRKGVFLRVKNLPKELLNIVKPLMSQNVNHIDWIIVKEILPKKEVLLEFWCSDFTKCTYLQNPCKYEVIQYNCDEDPNWICEGDLGRGYKE
jgi:hypothetical protein